MSDFWIVPTPCKESLESERHCLRNVVRGIVISKCCHVLHATILILTSSVPPIEEEYMPSFKDIC